MRFSVEIVPGLLFGLAVEWDSRTVFVMFAFLALRVSMEGLSK